MVRRVIVLNFHHDEFRIAVMTGSATVQQIRRHVGDTDDIVDKSMYGPHLVASRALLGAGVYQKRAECERQLIFAIVIEKVEVGVSCGVGFVVACRRRNTVEEVSRGAGVKVDVFEAVGR